MSQLMLHLLGAPRIERDGRPVTIGHSKAVALLAYLAVTHQYHTREALAALLWPDHDPTSARGEVRRMIWALNKSLGKEWLTIDRESVALLPQPYLWLDVDHFRHLLGAGQSHGHPASEVCQACLEALTKAVELVRGDFLAGFSLPDSPEFDTWQRFETESLRRELVGALERLVQFYQANGQGGSEQAIGYARQWVALDPLQEQAHRQLMQLYAQAGQWAAALRQYQVCTQALAEELEIEPSSETTTLYEAIKANRLPLLAQVGSQPPKPAAPAKLPLPKPSISPVPSLSLAEPAGRVPAALPPHLSAKPPLGTPSLPTPPTPLVGREHELATIARLLQERHCCLLTLVGPGGIGKTRLAIEAASNQQGVFADGVYFVSLAPVSSVEFIIPTIASALAFTFYGPTDPQRQLLNYLREKSMLLVLDNFEHLLASAKGADLLADLLQHAPGVKLLVTSRERLNLQGEWVFEVQGLPVPADDQTEGVETYSAIALFVQSARRLQADFSLTAETWPAVVRLCRLLEGLPLGIELAVAWTRLLSCHEIAQEAERSLDFLAISMRDAPARHRSMRAVFDHSWRLLSVEEQQVMRRLSVFRGGFRREAAEAVAGATLPLLSALMDKSLLRRTSTGRYDLHELIRQYTAMHQEGDPQEVAQTRERYVTYYTALLQQWEGQLRSPKQPQILAEMSLELDNLRLAWGWMVAYQQMANIQKSLGSLRRFYEVRGPSQEGVALFGQAVEALQTPGEAGAERGTDAEHTVVLARVLAHQGFFCAHLGRHEQARELLQKSLALLRPGTDRTALADTLASLGYTKYRLGEFVEASQYVQESLALNRALNNQPGTTFSLITLSYIYIAQEEYEKAYTLSSEGMAICRDVVGDPQGTVYCLVAFSAAASYLGRYAEAKQRAEEGLEISHALNDRRATGWALRRLGLISLELGEAEQAELLFRQSIPLFREIGDRPLMAVTLIELGRATRALEAYRESKQYFLEALQTGIETETLAIALTALTEIATLQMQAGAVESALELLMHVLQHPAGMPETKDHARQLLAKLESQLSPKQLETVQARVQARSFEAVAQEILDTVAGL